MMRARVLLAIFVVALLASTGGFAKDGDLRPFKRGSWQEIRQAHAGRPGPANATPSCSDLFRQSADDGSTWPLNSWLCSDMKSTRNKAT